MSKCGCACLCHHEEDPAWPGPCAGCCEPGDDCTCGRALAARDERIRALLIPHECSAGGYEPWPYVVKVDNYERTHCPADGGNLLCVIDYIGGGSHYWTLVCPVCETLYYYDTYSFKLGKKPDIVAYAIEHGITRIVDIAAL